jgi:hypothetical protein
MVFAMIFQNTRDLHGDRHDFKNTRDLHGF